ncbi:LysR family transcriptional regulator [Maritimibacter sp. 55A14]|uniref:LysR family transcriptional regulator n=1 Tax=Maritimibacter sp. 55A14 TaxID=2174844 RepID=UPI000D604C84|nr:LysR family transcriptional regulator [Maritimibacter sp. 55A14]PWE29904.1 LysR family transcriptional regulator [Maritimibacter sp. 55A14]
MLNWNDLRYVLETARKGGISGAARVLGVNHATVARRITAAEQALGARIFDRMSSGYVPTEAGWDAVRAAEAMERTGARLDRRIGARDAAVAGKLTVTAPQLLIERVLGPVLLGFIEEYPGVELQLLATNDILNLSRREADVAIRISDSPSPSLVGRRVCEQKAAVYATPELIARDPGGAAPLEWIRFAHWPGPSREIREARPNLNVRLSVDDMMAAVGAARAGIGATRMACFLGETDPSLQRVPGLPAFAYMPVWVLTHPDLRGVPRNRAFVDFVAARLRRMRRLFEGRAEGSPMTPFGTAPR